MDIIKNIIADYDKHYKRLKDRYTLKDGTIDEQAIKDCTDDDILNAVKEILYVEDENSAE